ncbi:hypothetical protein CL619_00070 [archaeon]|nr:hypothetical protein [archaeon]|tara:strand:+ start:1811 stop:2047 length:237 start_codon:yes stop_codon:yes gene_type:complete
MVQYINDGEGTVERFSTEDGEISSEEEGFLKGFEEDEETIECAECGSAVHEEAVHKVIDGENMIFCSDICAQDYADSI